MITLSWILGIVSVLGVGGTIVAFVFFPTVAVPVIQAAVSAILRCKPCLIALALVGTAIGFYWFGHHQAEISCRANELAAELAAKNADIDAAIKAKADATERANKIAEDANAQRQKDADYIATLKKKPSCILDGNDVGGTNGLRDRAVERLKKLAPGP